MIRIVILQRGFVVVGEVSRSDHEVVISDCAVIRRWGTTGKGLGGLRGGPTKDTVLDPCGTWRVHPLGIVAQQDVEQAPWAKVLKRQ